MTQRMKSSKKYLIPSVLMRPYPQTEMNNIVLKEIVSWRLSNSGNIEAMLIDEEKQATTPVLPGDHCLYPANKCPDFRYFFQHNIANKIKNQDPEAMAAISILEDGS